MNHPVRIAIGQLCSSSNLTKNLSTVTGLIADALDKECRLIFFPEATDFLSRNNRHAQFLAQRTPAFVEELQQRIRTLVRDKARPIDVSIGVHMPSPPGSTDKRTKNTLLYINHEGKILDEYQKVHLFDVDIKNGPIIKESNSVQPGASLPRVIDTPVGMLGSAICYDIRFPELAAYLRSQGAEMICYPSAFTMKTGEAHWELLGRTRAIDTQCFVIMPGQQGVHDIFADEWVDETAAETAKLSIKRESWGHSLIIDPWGTVIARSTAKVEPQLVIADLDFALLGKVRQDMPLEHQRRRDLFYR